MLRLITASAVAAVGLALAGPAAATTTDICSDFGPGRNTCRASTTETKATGAFVRLGTYSQGRYWLTCTKGNMTYTDTDKLRRGERRILDLGGLNRPTCTLRALAFNLHGRQVRARVTVFA